MLRTQLTRRWELDAPIVGAGMAFHALPPLVAAVSNAGAIGILGVGIAPPPALREMIRATRELSERPFGVDFITPFATPEHIEVCAEERVPIVVFFWGPAGAHGDRLREAGVAVWMQVGSPAEARDAVAGGAEVVIAQGLEAGGHNRGEAATFALVPAIVDAVGPVPVLAAGGIADGRGLAAALALGADGAWVGTRLLASAEAHVHDEYQRRIVAAGVQDTALTTLFGPEWPDQRTRTLRNRVVAEWAGREAEAPAPGDLAEPIGRTVVGGQEMPMPKFSVLLPTPETEGDFDEMCLLAGESAGLIESVEPAAQIVAAMAAEAEQIITGRLAQSAGPGAR